MTSMDDRPGEAAELRRRAEETVSRKIRTSTTCAANTSLKPVNRRRLNCGW